MVREGPPALSLPKINHSSVVVQIARQHLQDNGCEQFAVIAVDARNHAIGIYTTSVGTLSGTLVHPREVFGPALVLKAHGIVLIHNHPTGHADPSDEDNQLTTRLQQGCFLLGLRLLDHVIIGDGTDDYYSYHGKGVLPQT